jgi:hypothetical protein
VISRDALILLEEGPRVLVQQLIQDDPERGWRAVRGLMLNAARDNHERKLGDVTGDE